MTFSCICLCLMHAEVVLVHSLMRLQPTHSFIAPAWSITFDGARERGLIKGGFILVHVSANIMVRLRTKVWAHVCMRVLIVQVVNLRFSRFAKVPHERCALGIQNITQHLRTYVRATWRRWLSSDTAPSHNY